MFDPEYIAMRLQKAIRERAPGATVRVHEGQLFVFGSAAHAAMILSVSKPPPTIRTLYCKYPIPTTYTGMGRIIVECSEWLAGEDPRSAAAVDKELAELEVERTAIRREIAATMEEIAKLTKELACE